MRSLPRSAKLALLASTTLVGGFAALFAVDGGGVALPGKSLHGAPSGAAVLSAGRTRVIEASVFHMPSLDLASTARGFAGLATPVSLAPDAMGADGGEDRPDLRGADEDDPQGWPGVERGGKGDRWEIRPSTDLTLAPEASGTRAESDWLLPADGAVPLSRLSRRLEPPATGAEIQSFTRKRPSTILATTLTRAPDSGVIQTAATAEGGATPTTSRPDLASLDSRPAGGPTASPTVVAAPGDEEALPKVALATVRPNLDPDASDVGPVEPDEGLTSAQKRGKLAGLPGLDDGVARPLTLPPVAFTKAQNCLATAIYFEARSESEKGRIAVAQVIINRVRSPYYPKNVCDVVYQGASDRRYGGCQFSFACDRIRDRVRNREAFDNALSVAQRVLDAEVWLPEIGNATHYHATYVRPRWVRDMIEKDRIGRHIFYRVKWWA